jgi:hypothetical protein
MERKALRDWGTSRLGSIALVLVLLGFSIEYAQMMRPGQGCHPPIFDWFWRVGRLAFFGMLIGFILSMIGMIGNSDRGRAITAFGLFFPLFLLILSASGCG